MPLATNSAQQLRLRVNDKPRRRVVTLLGDGTASAYEVQSNVGGIVTGAGVPAAGVPSAYIPVGGTAWSATGATFNFNDGVVAFGGPISANSAFQCVYYDAVFNDEEIDYFTGNYGDLTHAHLEVVNTLLMDAYKRAAWAGGGVNYNDSKTLDNLMKVRDNLWAQITSEQGPQGGFESWAEEQQNNPPGSTWG